MSEHIPIPQCDPLASYLRRKEDIDAAIQNVLMRGRYILSTEVDEFEREFAAFHGGGHGIGVGNGTDALELSLRALGLEMGSLVFTVSHTAVATVAAIEKAGAKPILVDIDPATYTMCPRSLEEAIRFHSKKHGGGKMGVIVVHLYGQPASMEAIQRITREHGLYLIEDCAQAHGARLRNRRVGTFGDIAAFSFYPTKNLGAFGDAGAVLTSDLKLAERVRRLREYGWEERYISKIRGGNSRLDELQAAVLRVKLPGLDLDNGARRQIAKNYFAGIRSPAVELPQVGEGCEHVFHQFVVRSGKREALQKHLRERKVGTLIHYPVPVHRQPAYSGRVETTPAGLPETERLAGQVLSLPIFPELCEADSEKVVAAINQWGG